MNSEIEALIDQYQEDGDFTRVPPTEETLELVRKRLGVDLPDQFLEYLKEYSHGGIAGVEVLGIGLDGSVAFLDATVERRNYGLPENLVVVEDADEWVYCLDCNTGEVVSWGSLGGLRHEYGSFDAFLLAEYQDAIVNL